MVILDVNIACLERRLPSSEIYGDGAFRYRDSPEQPAFRDPRIEIVNLLPPGGSEYIKSYERERAVVVAPVRAHELASHEANVGFEGKMLRRLATNSVRALTAHCSPPNESIEVRYGRGLSTGCRQEHMEQRP